MSRLERLANRLSQRQSDVVPGRRALAAVALIFVPDPDALLLIRRAEHPGDPWSGQMGLPGGRRAEGDPDLLATAIRESKEEVGLNLASVRLLGVLEDHSPTTRMLPPILVRPFVFLMDSPRRPVIQSNAEVADAAWVELDTFLAPGVYGSHPVNAGGLNFERPGYLLPQGTVWGMTERILTPAFTLLGEEMIDI